MDVKVKFIDTKNVLSKSNLPVCDYSANPYVGCPTLANTVMLPL